MFALLARQSSLQFHPLTQNKIENERMVFWRSKGGSSPHRRGTNGHNRTPSEESKSSSSAEIGAPWEGFEVSDFYEFCET